MFPAAAESAIHCCRPIDGHPGVDFLHGQERNQFSEVDGALRALGGGVGIGDDWIAGTLRVESFLARFDSGNWKMRKLLFVTGMFLFSIANGSTFARAASTVESGSMELVCGPPIGLDLHLTGPTKGATLLLHLWASPVSVLKKNKPLPPPLHGARRRTSARLPTEPLNSSI
jgi:hypothetical protein